MNKERFLRLLNERILILDGGMGTMIQSFKLNEQDYRGERFADFPGQLKGNNDLLCITRPDVIQSIHRQYLDAGADIFATNTFNANAISMADYAMEAYVREINLAAADCRGKWRIPIWQSIRIVRSSWPDRSVLPIRQLP